MTEDITLYKTDGWKLIEKGEDKSILAIENVSSIDCRYRIGSSSESVGHTFSKGMYLTVTTDVYVTIPALISAGAVTIVATRID